jgi:hypothetical protein
VPHCYCVLLALRRPTPLLYLPAGFSILEFDDMGTLKSPGLTSYAGATYKPSLFTQCSATPKLALTVAIVSDPRLLHYLLLLRNFV